MFNLIVIFIVLGVFQASNGFRITHAEPLPVIQHEAIREKHTLPNGRKYTVLMSASTGNIMQRQGSIPLLVAAHCFGCVGSDLLNFAQPAMQLGFALVLPEESSPHAGWNAVECCGKSLQSGTDDLSFLREVIRDVAAQHPEVSTSAVYGSGWSNGGFLVTADALAVARGEQSARIFKAIAPISGFQYDHLAEVVNTRNGSSVAEPLPILMFHSIDDPLVRYEGCCSSGSFLRSTDHCCCGIGRGRGSCVSTPAVFDGYARLNGCVEVKARPSFTFMSPPPPSSQLPTKTAIYHDAGGFSCETRLGCKANTTLCTFPGGLGHFNGKGGFKDTFPSESLFEVGTFFAREACERAGGGKWQVRANGKGGSASSCDCPSGRVGRYCLNS
mmetsp:Transcript_28123/g.57675  ORF Transcript_28123/g.57675 Transcript_28123/m.57675 type:complete len:386 (-) Transcript_28123:1-1158(-)